MVYDQMNKLFYFVSICETVSCTHAMPLVLCAILHTHRLNNLFLEFSSFDIWNSSMAYIRTFIYIFVSWHIDTKASNQSVPIKYAHKTNGFWSGTMAVVVVETEYEKSDRHADRYETCLHPYTVCTLHFYSGFNCTLAWTYRDKKFWVL